MKTLDYAVSPRVVEEFLKTRSETDPAIELRVREILLQVASEGDEAVTSLTRQLECKFIDSLGLRVSDRERDAAYDQVGKKFLKALRIAKKNIEAFHRHQLPSSWTMRDGETRLSQRFSPLRRVGIYIPGGKASYPSTVLMNAIPAAIAGVGEVVMTTPGSTDGRISPEVLVAANECGIKHVYRIGGAQAIAAMAFGTESIPKVDKITGPGNAYVALAKKLVFGTVGIDMIAGPTEIVIIADDKASPRFVAADMLAQAEHDERASAVCLVFSTQFGERVEKELRDQLPQLERRSVAERSLADHGAIIRVSAIQDAAAIVNTIAPEHLELMVRKPGKYLDLIVNAGAIFVGEWSTEALGDYIAGPNHTLPTGGTARFSSPLGVLDFMKASNILRVSRKTFQKLAPHAEVLAMAEQLQAHARSFQVRREKR
jgi:histidinol dehydrogenase